MTHGFTFTWIMMGLGAVVVGKIIAAAAARVGLAM